MLLNHILVPRSILSMTSPSSMMVSGWKRNLTSIEFGYNDLEAILTSLSRKRNIILIWTWSSMQFFMLCLFNSKTSFVEICLSSSKYSLISYLTCFCIWLRWSSQLKWSHVLSPRNPNGCITIHMSPEYFQWKTRATLFSKSTFKLSLSLALPMTSFASPR